MTERATRVGNVAVFPVERTYLRKLIENDAFQVANKTLERAQSYRAVQRAYSHVPESIFDKELERINLFYKSRLRFYRRLSKANVPSAG